MAENTGVSVKLAKEFRERHGSKFSTSKLARLLRAENPLVYSSDENARYWLRYIEGKAGNKHRKNAINLPTYMSEPRSSNPFLLPESDETIFEPYVLKGHKRVALFSDIHLPYHSIEALTAALKFSKKEKPDGLVINGDMLDFHGLSRFVKDPQKRSFADELNTLQKTLEIFEKELKCKMYFKFGNHEERYDHFLWTKAKELVGVEEFELENIVKKRGNVEVIKDKRIIHAGGLNIIHGHEFSQGFFSPVNVARGLFLRAKTSAIQGHNHQTSEHTESDMNGKITTTWSCGALCELHPQFAPINKWNHGFAIIDLDGNDFEVRNKRIYNGKVL